MGHPSSWSEVFNNATFWFSAVINGCSAALPILNFLSQNSSCGWMILSWNHWSIGARNSPQAMPSPLQGFLKCQKKTLWILKRMALYRRAILALCLLSTGEPFWLYVRTLKENSSSLGFALQESHFVSVSTLQESHVTLSVLKTKGEPFWLGLCSAEEAFWLFTSTLN